MKVIYDPETDSLYIDFRPLGAGEARCRDLSEEVTVDYGPDGKLAGIEVLDASILLGEELNRVVLEITPMMKTK